MLLFAFGRVAELVDALRSGRSGRKAVEVQVLSRLPIRDIKKADAVMATRFFCGVHGAVSRTANV